MLAVSPYDVSQRVDLPLTGSLAAFTLVTELTKDHLVTNGCRCALADVPAIDRIAVGPYNRAVGISSDVLVGAVLAAPFLAGGIEAWATGDLSWLKDALVLAETLSLTMSVNQIVKLTVQRPRPFVYAGEPATGDNVVSFFSLHASTSFALMNAAALTFAWRHPKSPWRAFVWIAGNLAAAGIALLRVAAHKHFVTDVLVGGAVGALFGVIVPFAHRRGVSLSASPLPSGAHVAVGYRW